MVYLTRWVDLGIVIALALVEYTLRKQRNKINELEARLIIIEGE